MKIQINFLLLLLFPFLGSFADTGGYYGLDHILSASAAGEADSTAVHMSSNSIVAWADDYTNVHYGIEVDAQWKVPEKALGPANGIAEEIVSLGRGGDISLTFPDGIGDGAGADFVVFENGVSDGFLELAWVEVSSDGTNFVRFPNYSYTSAPVGSYGEVNTRLVYGLASKYRLEYGAPFDLNDLSLAYNAQLIGETDFSVEFALQLTNNFPVLDLNNITYLRLVDIVGNGSAQDARGEIIYDPYPTTGSAGFDLDAVGVLHASIFAQFSYTDWAENYLVSPDGRGDADGDGVIDFQEYMMGGDPNIGTSAPIPFLGPSTNGSSSVVLEYVLSRHALGASWVETSTNLVAWTNAIPEQVVQEEADDLLLMKAQFPSAEIYRFYRLVFEEQ